MTDNIFQFSHEGVDAVTIDGVTFLNMDQMMDRLASIALGRASQLAMQAMLAEVTGTPLDPETAMALAKSAGEVEGYEFLDALVRHWSIVSQRLQDGLPAHMTDEEVEAEKEAAIDAEVQAFASALDEGLPPTFLS